MKRMTLSMVCVLSFFGIGLMVSSAMADEGRGANATVSFGQWETDPPLDRFFIPAPAGGASNNHELLPNVVKIKTGGAVNFIIGGNHIPTIFDDGTQPEDINRNNIEPPPAPQVAGGVLSDAVNRIYRGINPGALRDQVQVVQFSKPGTYLVICAFRNHFFNPTTQQFEMFGFVEVRGGEGD